MNYLKVVCEVVGTMNLHQYSDKYLLIPKIY